MQSVTQVNTSTLGVAPSHAIATMYQTTVASAGIAIQNAIHAQSNQYSLNLATAAEAINLLLKPSSTEIETQQLQARLASLMAQLNPKPADK